MALAGTMACADGACVPLDAWSEKNRREQRLVAQYVRDLLRQLTIEPEESETYVRKVGAICHLETDFRFLLPEGLGVGTVLSRLHPTPAVCGVPTESARRAILACEPEPRRYYAGFCGPLNLLHETRLYVNLRCLEVMPSLLRFHAGGGLLLESNEEDEMAGNATQNGSSARASHSAFLRNAFGQRVVRQIALLGRKNKTPDNLL